MSIIPRFVKYNRAQNLNIIIDLFPVNSNSKTTSEGFYKPITKYAVITFNKARHKP